VATTDSQHGFTIYPNLAQYVRVSATNQLWVADITYLRLGRVIRVKYFSIRGQLFFPMGRMFWSRKSEAESRAGVFLF
jgi:hypothetical protein